MSEFVASIGSVFNHQFRNNTQFGFVQTVLRRFGVTPRDFDSKYYSYLGWFSVKSRSGNVQ